MNLEKSRRFGGHNGIPWKFRQEHKKPVVSRDDQFTGYILEASE